MTNSVSSRKPTEAELEELYELLDTLYCYDIDDVKEPHLEIPKALEVATFAVIENLKSQNSQCSGKMMLVIWADRYSHNFDLYRWNEEGNLEEVEQFK